MTSSSSEDEPDTFPERPTRIQPYQFEPVRQDFENTGTSCQLRSKPHAVFHGVCKIALTEVLATQKGVMQRSNLRKSACLNCINLIHFCLTAGRLRRSSGIVIPGVICELLQFVATQ